MTIESPTMHTDPIIGPDPAALTDAEIMLNAGRIAALSQRVAHCPGQTPSAAALAELDQADRWLYEALRVTFLILVAENDRRLAADDAAIHAGFERLLADGTGA